MKVHSDMQSRVHATQYSNWLVMKDGQVLMVTHKTNLQSVLDKLPRGENIYYDITPVGDVFINIQKEPAIDPQGVLNIKFHDDAYDYYKDLKGKYGIDCILGGENAFRINTSVEQLFDRVKNKLTEEELAMIVASMKGGNL